jgi:hypothetical protein
VEWIKRNPSQAIGFFFSFVGLVLMPAIASIADEAELLGAPPGVFVALGAILLAVTIAGRVWQALRGSWPVSWGYSSVVGFLVAAVAELAANLQAFTDALDPVGIPAGVWHTIAVVLAAVTSLLRYAQSVDPGRVGGPVIIAEPVPEEGGADEPEVEPEL